jgi:pre-mRNA-splicing factor CDC5/CEF1
MAGSDFGGITPARKEARTPNVLATPQRLATPGAGGAGMTPMRDALGLNSSEQEWVAAGDGAHAMAAAQRRAASELRGALALLPAPANEYELVVPEAPTPLDAAALADAPLDEDAADRAARLERHERALADAELARASSVLRRQLPRPLTLGKQAKKPDVDGGVDSVDALLAAELRDMMAREHCQQLPSGGKPASAALRQEVAARHVAPNVDIAQDERCMAEARDLLDIERRLLVAERDGASSGKRQRGASSAAPAPPPAYASLDAFREHLDSAAFDPRSKRAVVLDKSAANADRLAVALAAAERAHVLAQQTAARIARLAKKTTLQHQGYATRAAALLDDIRRVRNTTDAAHTQLAAFTALGHSERVGGAARLANARQRQAAAVQREQRQQVGSASSLVFTPIYAHGDVQNFRRVTNCCWIRKQLFCLASRLSMRRLPPPTTMQCKLIFFHRQRILQRKSLPQRNRRQRKHRQRNLRRKSLRRKSRQRRNLRQRKNLRQRNQTTMTTTIIVKMFIRNLKQQKSMISLKSKYVECVCVFLAVLLLILFSK